MTVAVAASGSYVDARDGRVTFREYAAQWIAAQPHRATTAASVKPIMRVHVFPTFGARRLASIRTSEVQAWLSGLELAPSTVAVVYGKVAAVFRAAVEDRIIAHSPCTRRVRLPRPDGGEVVPMSPEPVPGHGRHGGDRYTELTVLLMGTGMRPGEALGLTADRVEFLRRTIRLDRQLFTMSNTPRARTVQDDVKCADDPGTRRLKALAAHMAAYEPGRLGVIFTDGKGDPIRRNALGHVRRRAAAKAGVEGFTPHDLCHSAASVMIDHGASVKAVQCHLGLASATTTLDVYIHLWKDSDQVTRAALATGLEQIASPVRHAPAVEA